MRESKLVKIRVAVPAGFADKIRAALGESGAGQQGNYDHCSFSYPVTGRFRPLPGANPALGEVGKLEEVAEEIIEMLCHQDKVKAVITELKAVHPYEEPAIDIIPRFELE